MVRSELNIIVAHFIEGFPREFIPEQRRVAFDKRMQPFFLDQVGCDAFDFDRWAAMQRRQRRRVADFRRNRANIRFRNFFKAWEKFYAYCHPSQ